MVRGGSRRGALGPVLICEDVIFVLDRLAAVSPTCRGEEVVVEVLWSSFDL